VGTAKVQLTAEQVAELRRLHADGVSRNQIAKALGISTATLTRRAAELDPPVDFDQRPYLAAAVEHNVLALQKKRTELSEDAMDKAARLVGDLEREHEVTMLGQGPDGSGSQWFSTRTRRPDPRASKDLAQAASILANLSMKLVEFDRAQSPETEEAIGALSGLSTALHDVARQLGAPDTSVTEP
jgi:helix-turn-helix resolvase-like protein